MKKLGKLIGGICVGALAAGLIPYRFRKDEETGDREVRSLLWVWKKTLDGDKYTYAFSMPPSGLESKPAAEAEPAAAEAEAEAAETVAEAAETAPAEEAAQTE